MRLTVSDEGMKTPYVCSFISIEAEYGEKRGHSLSILPRERRTPLYLVKARSPPWRESRPLLLPKTALAAGAAPLAPGRPAAGPAMSSAPDSLEIREADL